MVVFHGVFEAHTLFYQFQFVLDHIIFFKEFVLFAEILTSAFGLTEHIFVDKCPYLVVELNGLPVFVFVMLDLICMM